MSEVSLYLKQLRAIEFELETRALDVAAHVQRAKELIRSAEAKAGLVDEEIAKTRSGLADLTFTLKQIRETP